MPQSTVVCVEWDAMGYLLRPGTAEGGVHVEEADEAYLVIGSYFSRPKAFAPIWYFPPASGQTC